MEKPQNHNDNDIVILERNNNDIDIDVDNRSKLRERVLSEITEYKLNIIQQFMFGGCNKFFGDCTVFVNPAIKQVERFTYIWMNELSEKSRKIIINYCINSPIDNKTREYSQYTNSPVWKYISSIIKLLKNYTCENCEKRFNPAHLVVHHCSYAHLGSEINHLDEVAVLCRDCHMKVHGIRRDDEC